MAGSHTQPLNVNCIKFTGFSSLITKINRNIQIINFLLSYIKYLFGYSKTTIRVVAGHKC